METENLQDVINAKYNWLANSSALNRHSKLAWCFHLASQINVWIEFRNFNPLIGIVYEKYFAETVQEKAFNDLEELEAILVVWKRV